MLCLRILQMIEYKSKMGVLKFCLFGDHFTDTGMQKKSHA